MIHDVLLNVSTYPHDVVRHTKNNAPMGTDIKDPAKLIEQEYDVIYYMEI